MNAKKLLSIEEALDIALNAITSIDETIEMPIQKTLSYVLADDVISQINVPSFDNSAVDGFALRIEDYKDTRKFRISQRITAGSNPEEIEEKTAVKIFTGAPIPKGVDTVVMLEDCSEEDGYVTLPETVKINMNIRPMGQDVKKGETVLTKGTKIKPQEMGLIASVGIKKLKVYRPLRVAIVSTGSELIEPGEEFSYGKIYNSNRFLLKGLLQSLNCEIIDMGIAYDDYTSTREIMLKALNRSDIVITTGGVSVSDEDHIKNIIADVGEKLIWKIAIKPGKPFTFGVMEGKPVIGLPGNPSAVLVTFLIMARAILKKLQGLNDLSYISYKIPIDFSVKKSNTRRSFIHCQVQNSEEGPVLKKFSNQSSGMLSSASWAHGLALIAENSQPQRGEIVNYIPFSELLS